MCVCVRDWANVRLMNSIRTTNVAERNASLSDPTTTNSNDCEWKMWKNDHNSRAFFGNHVCIDVFEAPDWIRTPQNTFASVAHMLAARTKRRKKNKTRAKKKILGLWPIFSNTYAAANGQLDRVYLFFSLALFVCPSAHYLCVDCLRCWHTALSATYSLLFWMRKWTLNRTVYLSIYRYTYSCSICKREHCRGPSECVCVCDKARVVRYT